LQVMEERMHHRRIEAAEQPEGAGREGGLVAARPERELGSRRCAVRRVSAARMPNALRFLHLSTRSGGSEARLGRSTAGVVGRSLQSLVPATATARAAWRRPSR
jgi:hypothetical protein